MVLFRDKITQRLRIIPLGSEYTKYLSTGVREISPMAQEMLIGVQVISVSPPSFLSGTGDCKKRILCLEIRRSPQLVQYSISSLETIHNVSLTLLKQNFISLRTYLVAISHPPPQMVSNNLRSLTDFLPEGGGVSFWGVALKTVLMRVVRAAWDRSLAFHPDNLWMRLSRIREAFLLAILCPSMKPPKYLLSHRTKLMEYGVDGFTRSFIGLKEQQNVIRIHEVIYSRSSSGYLDTSNGFIILRLDESRPPSFRLFAGPNKVKDFTGNKNVILDITPLNKGILEGSNEIRKDTLQPICKDFGDNFVVYTPLPLLTLLSLSGKRETKENIFLILWEEEGYTPTHRREEWTCIFGVCRIIVILPDFPLRFGLPLSNGPQMRDSILIFLTVGGSVIPMRIMETDSIASVKLRIQTFKGFFVKKQKLVFEGRELARNNSCVRDYGVTNGNVLHLVLRLSDIQAITVRTICGKEFEFYVEKNRNVGYVKQQIARKGKGFVNIKDQELICDGEALEDQRLVEDICKDDDAVIHLLVRRSAKVRTKAVEKDIELSIEASDTYEKVVNLDEEQLLERKQSIRDFLLEPIIVNPNIRVSKVIWELIKTTSQGLERGKKPIQSSEGSGGAYLMQDSSGSKYVSVFKPIDEEPMAVNNPRGLPISVDGEGLKKGTRVGQGAFREVAAYILDHPRKGPRSYNNNDEQGFAGVPPTVMVKCLHKGFHHPKGCKYNLSNVKIGSLQMFMRNIGSCEDMGPLAFPVEEVHKISVLDIRLANADRHAGNILVSKDGEDGRIVLIPIDHGYCLPENVEDCTFDWLYWPQAQEPYSADTIEYIKSLDAEADIKLLKFHGWDLSPECARVLRISTMLLKKGAERGLTPFTIGSIMCRETLKKKSVMEHIIEEAEEALVPGSSEDAFLHLVSLIMDKRLDELPL
ncbi:Phosphatidylinositol 4-kinase gamma 3 [Senna tora]|uniref:1-phosphatidylinositol 4-kinase n=1 Tax=Senna tora TaxID=362788 RepID=A0A834U1Q5_9FABA|nr:Phosphatidylinositol 4-kinase gamma 3 [Senna tora]